MELSGDRIINAPQDRLYDALHDPVTLRQILPGCQSLSVNDGKAQITSVVKVGPVRANVSTTVEVFNEDRPAGYSLYAIANAGPAGSGAGTAHVALAAVDEATTNLAYHLSVDFEGRFAELGQSVLEETARTLIAEFFSRLKLLLETPEDGVIVAMPASSAESRTVNVDEIAAPVEEPLRPAPPPPPPPPPRRPVGTPASTRMVFGDASPGADEPDVDANTLTSEPIHRGTPIETDPRETARTAPTAPQRADAAPTNALPRELRSDPRRPPETMSNAKRWFLVAVGVAVIIFLLSGGF